MLAYRHAFHAGNDADVLKHVALVHVLRHASLKGKPYTYVDTHAGAGRYGLGGREAHKTGEYRNGIARLWQRSDPPEAVADYLAVIRRFNPEGRLQHYPGSPLIAEALRRPQDRLRLYELHPTDYRALSAAFDGLPDVGVIQRDGFAAPRAELPPPSRRGVLLMDPSYEIKTDYAKVAGALRDALGRFADGTFVVWYPQVQLLESAQLVARLKAITQPLAPRGWLHARLTLHQADERGFGLIGSGVFVVNPPFTLHAALRTALPWLADAMTTIDKPEVVLEQHAV